AAQKQIRAARYNKLSNEYEKALRDQVEREKNEEFLRNRNEAWARELGQKPPQTNTSSPVSQPPQRNGIIKEMSDQIDALKDSLKDLKIRVIYLSGETFEGIRKRDDWQNEDYIYGTTKDSDKSVRVDIAKVRSIKVKTNE